jgi:hypothetical protein
MDYAAWAQRVSLFLRSLTQLPGEIDIHDGIEPPGTDDFTQGWLGSDECSLPSELKAFVATASRRCNFRYRWKPPEQLQAKIGALLPDQGEVTGGADLCESYRFHNFDNRQWFQQELPPLFDKAALFVAGLFHPDVAAAVPTSEKDMMNSLMKGAGVTDAARTHGRVPLLTLPGGDQISLESDVTLGARPVVYVPSVDSGESRIVSTSFDQFLSDWEQLCYITPTLANLAPWCDPANGRLSPHNGTTSLLREILTMSNSGERSDA